MHLSQLLRKDQTHNTMLQEAREQGEKIHQFIHSNNSQQGNKQFNKQGNKQGFFQEIHCRDSRKCKERTRESAKRLEHKVTMRHNQALM